MKVYNITIMLEAPHTFHAKEERIRMILT